MAVGQRDDKDAVPLSSGPNRGFTAAGTVP